VTLDIRPAGENDVDAIVALLHGQMNRKIAPERWRRLFAYPWLDQKPDLGRVAVEGERVVGYVGMVHADRDIGGRRERIVNVCAWFLDKEFRGRGLGHALMAEATADDRASYTILTSSAKTRKILDAVGYRELDAERRVWRRRGTAPARAISFVEDPARIIAEVGARSRRLLRDHEGMPVQPMLIGAEGRTCLLVFSVKLKGDDVAYWDLLHVRDRVFFSAYAQDLADTILPAGKKAVLAADLRFVDPSAQHGERERFAVPRFFKTMRLRPEEIDNLYSEIQLLDLKLD
jgi:GNAT superfamily N-acetyltransferase